MKKKHFSIRALRLLLFVSCAIIAFYRQAHAGPPVVSNVVAEQARTSAAGGGDPNPEKATIRFTVSDPDGDPMRIRMIVYGEGGPAVLADTSESLIPFSWADHPSFSGVQNGDYEVTYWIQKGVAPPVGSLPDAPIEERSIFFTITADDGHGGSPDRTLRVRQTKLGQIKMVEIPDADGNPRFWMSQTEVTYGQYGEVYHELAKASTSPGVYRWVSQWGEFSKAPLGANAATEATHPNIGPLEGGLVWLNFLSYAADRKPVYVRNGDVFQNADPSFLPEVRMEPKNSGYRLPTVEEWMYACDALGISSTAGHYSSKEDTTKPVSSYDSNGFGLFDIRGNLSEYAWDDSGSFWSGTVGPPVVICGSDLRTGDLPCGVSQSDWRKAFDNYNGSTGLRIVTTEMPGAAASPSTVTISGSSGDGGAHTVETGWLTVDLSPRVDPVICEYDRFGRGWVVEGGKVTMQVCPHNPGEENTARPMSLRAQQPSPAGFIFQWYKDDVALQDGGSISGSRTDTLTISPVTSDMTGSRYYVVVTPTDPSIRPATSKATTLQVADTEELKLGVATGFPDWRWATGGDRDFKYDADTFEWRVAVANVDEGQVSVIQAKVAGPGTLSFSWATTLRDGELLYATSNNTVSYKCLLDHRELLATLTERKIVLDPNDPFSKFRSPYDTNARVEGIEIPSGEHTLQWSFINNRADGVGDIGAFLWDVDFEGAWGRDTRIFAEPGRLILPNGKPSHFHVLVPGKGEDIQYQWFEGSFAAGGMPMLGQTSPWLILPDDDTSLVESRSFYVMVNSGPGSADRVETVFLEEYDLEELVHSLDNPSLAWTTGGDAPWHPNRDGSLARYDGDSAMSNELNDLGSSWIETEVTGPAMLAFDWSVSSERDFDFLRFFIDDVVQDEISGDISWEKSLLNGERERAMVFVTKQYEIPPGSHRVKWAYEKDPADVDPVHKDQGYLDNVRVFPLGAVKEALDDPNLEWETGGLAPWTPDYDFSRDGVGAVRSGSIRWANRSWIQTSVTGPGTLTFQWNILASTEPSQGTGARLDFYIDDVQERYPYGLTGWRQVIMEIPAGVHTLKWEYEKDSSPFGLADAAWLDQVAYTQFQRPQITREPESQTVSTGGQAKFTVVATGMPEPDFQWQKDGQNIDGAVQATYTIENAQGSDAGAYVVVVSNAAGSVSSGQAFLQVDDSPADSTKPTTTIQTKIFVTPTLFKLDDAPVGSSVSRALTILNTGGADLKISSITSNLGDVVAASETQFTVPPRSAHDITVTISPSTEGPLSGSLVIVANTPDSPIEIPIIGNALPSRGGGSSGDFNGDSKPDFIWQHNNGSIAAWFMDGRNLKSGSLFSPSNSGDVNWRIAGRGDFNGDSRPDLIWQHTDGSIAAWFMDGVTLAGGALFNPSTPGNANWQIVGSNDLDGDSKTDLIWQHTDGSLAAWFMDGLKLTSGSLFTPSTPGDRDWRLVGTGDFNGDGKPDLIWQHANGTLAAWFMDGVRMASASLLKPSTPGDRNWRVIGAGDYNGDSKPDLIWQHSRGSIAIWFMDGVNRIGGGLTEPARSSDVQWKLVPF